MAVSFPPEVFWHIGSLSAPTTLARLSQTCRLLSRVCAPVCEQRRMGMSRAPWTFVYSLLEMFFQSYFLTPNDVLRTWDRLTVEECRVVRTNLRNQPLVVYAHLSPHIAALDAFCGDGSSYIDRGDYLSLAVRNECLPRKTALKIVSLSQENENVQDRALFTIATGRNLLGLKSKKSASGVKPMKIADSIRNVLLRDRAYVHILQWKELSLPFALFTIKNLSNEFLIKAALYAIHKRIPLFALREICREEPSLLKVLDEMQE